MASILAQKNFNNATKAINTALERLSSGNRINNPSDDAAGLTISAGLTTQIQGCRVAHENAQLGINLLQVAEGDLSVIQDNIQRIRELLVQAANGTYGSAERKSIKKEVQARVEENDLLVAMSKFNTISLLDGKSTGLTLKIGLFSGTVNNLKVGGVLKSVTSSQIGLKNILNSFGSALKASSYISTIDSALEQISNQRANVGALQNRLNSTITSLDTTSENLEASVSNIKDVDIAKEASVLTKNQILQKVAASLISQANQSPGIALSLI